MKSEVAAQGGTWGGCEQDLGRVRGRALGHTPPHYPNADDLRPNWRAEVVNDSPADSGRTSRGTPSTLSSMMIQRCRHDSEIPKSFAS